jgi:hypothetical protein
MKEITERAARALAPLAILALSLGSASMVGLGPVTQAAAATDGITVFVGYADSIHALGEFPNPWDGSPNVTFDGCTPASACTFDAGAVRVENDSTSSVLVNQVSVHLGACLYTWTGPLYPVKLAPGSSLITTQRMSGAAAGCTGPDPASFDSSDFGNAGCSNDGLLPTVDVTVDGVTTSNTDSGQVLNTGGLDPVECTNVNESTEWVPLGSKPCPGQSLSLTPASQTHSIATTAAVTAAFINACGSPLSGVLVHFNVTAGPNIGVTGSAITNVAGNASFSYSSLLTGTDKLSATITNPAGFTATSNTADVTWTVEFAPGGGSFVIGNNNAVLGGTVDFWGAEWAKRNSLTGGPAPRSFKGFAEEPTSPACGENWTTDPGNSTPPPDGPLPTLMAVIVTSSSHQSGPNISGDIVEIVLVKTDAGYEPNPGHAGTGTVVAIVCGGSVRPASTNPQRQKVTSSSVASGSANLPTSAAPSNPPSAGRTDGPTTSHGAGVSTKSECLSQTRGVGTPHNTPSCGRPSRS